MKSKRWLKKGDKLYVKWRGYDSSFNGSINKKGIVEMSKYFPEPTYSGGRMKVELDLSIICLLSDRSRFKKCSSCWLIKIC